MAYMLPLMFSRLILWKVTRRPVPRSSKGSGSPLFHIVANAGLEGAVIVNKVKESSVGEGFDAA